MMSRKVVKRACDGCKIRKIKCSEVAPCDGCVATGIACTFVKHPAVRGPRRLRKSTLEEISKTQQQWEQLALPPPLEPVVHTRLDEENVFAPSKIAALVLQLCIFRLRVYPIWPIIKVERLVASLQKPEPDIEVFALAYAIAAATIARIKPTQAEQHGGVTAKMMEAQCLYAKARRPEDLPPDLTTVRIPFFLHIYHEENEPGGLRSITYLREAIAIAHMIGLHREEYYLGVQREEQEIRRRTLWLLFVTERSVSIKHKLPVTIKTTIEFPSTTDTDEHEVLLAYQQLISMFWHFDKSGVFEMLDNCGFDLSRVGSRQDALNGALDSLRKQLDETDLQTQSLNSIQALDIVVSRHWMRVILWRLAASHGFFSQSAEAGALEDNNPIAIARELLEAVTRADKSVIEAHGPVLETKIFEIASTVADACAIAATEATNPTSAYIRQQAVDVLAQLHRLLLKNKHLAGMLQAKLVKSRLSLDVGMNDSECTMDYSAASVFDAEIERQLHADGFHFTELPELADSPDMGSTGSSLQHDSPSGQDFDPMRGQTLQGSRTTIPHHSMNIQQSGPGSAFLGWNNSDLTHGAMAYSNNPELDSAFQRLGYGLDSMGGFHSLYPSDTNASN